MTARVKCLYISDALCDYILVTNTSMLLGNISGNKDDCTAVRLSRESFVPRTCSVPLVLNLRIRATQRNPKISRKTNYQFVLSLHRNRQRRELCKLLNVLTEKI